MNNQRIALAMLLLVWSNSQAIDSSITVLAVKTGGANVTIALSQMDYLEANWPTNGISPLQIANGGVPVSLTTAIYSGSDESQLSAAETLPNLANLRNTYGADVVLIFTGTISGTACGLVRQFNWTRISNNVSGVFIPSSQNNFLDLNGKDDSYYGIVSTDTNKCPALTAAHELGHLLAGGHTALANPGDYLRSDSHALADVVEVPPGHPAAPNGGFIGYKTILAEGANPPVCTNHPQGPVSCTYIDHYSSISGAADNQGTFVETGLSVANYRTSQSGGGACVLQTPSNVQKSLVGYCSPYPYSQYIVSWSDACPSATSYYEVYKQQPLGTGWFFGWQSFVPATNAYINGALGAVSVKACNSLFYCTPLSSSIQFLHDGC